jgi:hypothetical protein
MNDSLTTAATLIAQASDELKAANARIAELEAMLTALGDLACGAWDDKTVGAVDSTVDPAKQYTYAELLRTFFHSNPKKIENLKKRIENAHEALDESVHIGKRENTHQGLFPRIFALVHRTNKLTDDKSHSLSPSDHVGTFGGEAEIDNIRVEHYGLTLGKLSISNISPAQMSELAIKMVNHLMACGHEFRFVNDGSLFFQKK